MPDDLTPADPADLVQALSYGLRFNTVGKPHRHGHELAARIAAEMLVQHLDRSGFVVLRKPGAPAHAKPPGKG